MLNYQRALMLRLEIRRNIKSKSYYFTIKNSPIDLCMLKVDRLPDLMQCHLKNENFHMSQFQIHDSICARALLKSSCVFW
jgi:hypothetical protein